MSANDINLVSLLSSIAKLDSINDMLLFGSVKIHSYQLGNVL